MDQTTTTSPAPSTGPMGGKMRSPLFMVIIAVVVTAVVVGVGAYLVANWQGGIAQEELNKKIIDVEGQKGTLQEDFNACQTSLYTEQQGKTALEDQIKKAENEANAVYQSWKDYTDTKYGLQWKYPSDWTVLAREIAPTSGVVNKYGFCLNFESADDILLNICYRKKDDDNSTTWFRTGLGFPELGKIGINVKMGDKVLTEKTLYGAAGKVQTIIYAQNLQDDGTGFPARFASGNYYFTVMADNFGTGGAGISSEDQLIIENILRSVKF